MRIANSDIPPFLIGLAALPAQAVLLRELLARGGGNELTLTLYLASWLAGSALGARWWQRLAGSPGSRFGGLLLGGCIVSIIAISVARLLPQPGAIPGEIPSPAAILLWGACVFFPPAFRTAGLFPLAVECAAGGGSATTGPGRAYAAEAIGAVVGGLLTTILVFARVPSISILLLDLAVVLMVVARGTPARLLAAAFVLLVLAGGSAAIDRWLFDAAWRESHPGARLVGHAVSPSRTIVVAEREGERWLLADNALLGTLNDPYADEAVAALLLSVVPRVERTLLVGFGGSGVSTALHRAGVPMVECLLPDREDTLLVPPVPGVAYTVGDPRARLRSVDGGWDVIAISSGEAVGIGANRLWTAEAFRSMASRLSPGGAIVAVAPGGEAAPIAGANGWRMSIAAALGEAVRPVEAMDVDHFVLIGSGEAGLASLDPDSLAHRMRRSGRTLSSYPPERFAIEYPADRRVRIIRSEANHDSRPAAVALALRRWSRMVGLPPDIPHGLPLAILILVGAIVLAPWVRGGRGEGVSVLLATGAASIGLDLLVLMTYQARVGILHAGLGVLLGAFLGGTALGAMLAERQAAGHPARSLLFRACLVQAGLSIAAGFVLGRLPIGDPILSTLPYAAIAILLGMTCGFPFPIVARESTIALAWSTDAAGGILGAVLFLTVIAWGSIQTGVVLGLLPLIATVRIVAAHRS